MYHLIILTKDKLSTFKDLTERELVKHLETLRNLSRQAIPQAVVVYADRTVIGRYGV